MTRCDVYVDCDGQMSRVAQPDAWGTWWALDGGDSVPTLLALDQAGYGVCIASVWGQGHVFVSGPPTLAWDRWGGKVEPAGARSAAVTVAEGVGWQTCRRAVPSHWHAARGSGGCQRAMGNVFGGSGGTGGWH